MAKVKEKEQAEKLNLKGYFLLGLMLFFVLILLFGYITWYYVENYISVFSKANPFSAGNIVKIVFGALIVSAWNAYVAYACRLKIFRSEAKGKRQPKTYERIFILVCWALLLFSLVIIFGNIWIKRFWNVMTAEELVFHLIVPLTGASPEMVFSFVLWVALPTALVLSICAYIAFESNKKNLILSARPFRKVKNITVLSDKMFGVGFPIFSLIALVTGIVITNHNYDLETVRKQFFSTSNFIEENYLDPRAMSVTFPEKKRNLIYIIVESLESSFLSAQLGGAQKENLIPGLTALGQDNVNFSNGAGLGGAYSMTGTTWTIAAMVGQTAGLPFKVPIDANRFYHGNAGFILPGAYTLGEILENAGYKQAIIMGSQAEFAARDAYYETHGNYEVLDYDVALEKGITNLRDRVWWGLEDKNLYEWAKDEISELSKQEQPFNVTVLTVDTHHADGWLCDKCESRYASQYWNVVACADTLLLEFTDWIKMQDFYENTTVIITGDHLTMDPGYSASIPNEYPRRVYNVFINSAVQPHNEKNRKFTSFDMLPTTLAAIGATIEGERLALGTNLFSNEQTLTELIGEEKMSRELEKVSRFYNERFFDGKKLR